MPKRFTCRVRRVPQGAQGHPAPHIPRDPARSHAASSGPRSSWTTRPAKILPLLQHRSRVRRRSRGANANEGDRPQSDSCLILVAGRCRCSSAPPTRCSEQEQVIITQFGDPVGDPITAAGLHFKAPFIQTRQTGSRNAFSPGTANPARCRPRTRPTSSSIPSPAGAWPTPSSTFAGCATNAAPCRGSTTSSAARPATPSPATS